jgi:hypothetical protein
MTKKGRGGTYLQNKSYKLRIIVCYNWYNSSNVPDNSTEQSSSWEANRSSASQEIRPTSFKKAHLPSLP